MRIKIHTRRFVLTDGLRDHVVRRIDAALERHRLWVQRVDVQLGDVNGPRGGRDKLCRVLVHFSSFPAIVVRDIGSDLYAVISSAADRVGANVGRRLAQRIRTKRRFGMRLESRMRLALA